MNRIKERPIIFNTEMVQAILDNRKTQTRRLRGLKGINENPDYWKVDKILLDGTFVFNGGHGYEIRQIKCPYGKIGDRLWVRETWRLDTWTVDHTQRTEAKTYYKADNDRIFDINGNIRKFKWKSSRFMPYWASRITLEITNIRVERLQEIILDEIKAEGISITNLDELETAKSKFMSLWDSINPEQSYYWGSNPGVWAIEFKRL